MIHTDAGYYTPTGLPPGASGPSYVHLWYLKEHLGNNCVLANERGIALSTHHYDPYGTEISISTTNPSNPFLPGMADSPYKYGGKEWNAATSTYDFEAPMVVQRMDHCRHWWGGIGRRLQAVGPGNPGAAAIL